MPDLSSSFKRRDIERTSFVNANHMDMVKLSNANDPTYDTFRTALREYLRRAQKSVHQPEAGRQDDIANISGM